jgi:hypothetical protein
MIIGTMFTLFVVPSIYMLVAKTHKALVDEEDSLVGLGKPAEAAF